MSDTIMGFQSQFYLEPKPPKLTPEDHNPINQDDLLEAIKSSTFGDEFVGFCISCGSQHYDGIEPDARNYPCDNCDRPQVFGAQELLIMGYLKD